MEFILLLKCKLNSTFLIHFLVLALESRILKMRRAVQIKKACQQEQQTVNEPCGGGGEEHDENDFEMDVDEEEIEESSSQYETEQDTTETEESVESYSGLVLIYTNIWINTVLLYDLSRHSKKPVVVKTALVTYNAHHGSKYCTGYIPCIFFYKHDHFFHYSIIPLKCAWFLNKKLWICGSISWQ